MTPEDQFDSDGATAAGAQKLMIDCNSTLINTFIQRVKVQPNTVAVRNSCGDSLTYTQLLLRAIVIANDLKKTLARETTVGIMIPPSNEAVIANLALGLLGKIVVNLNYTMEQDRFNQTVENCDLRYIITASIVLRKTHLKLPVQHIYLEEIASSLSILKKAVAWVETEVMSEIALAHLFPGLDRGYRVNFESLGLKISASPRLSDDPCNIIFTSGSTAMPKGVVLSHRNILSNIAAIKQCGEIQRGEVILGVIPFFHSFGLTMTLWAPLCLGETVIYHYDPFDARRIASLIEQYRASCLVATPTMMNTYLRKAEPSYFKSLTHCVLGGEKVQPKLFDDIQNQLGITPLEGYGLAETSPIIACNVPVDIITTKGTRIPGTRKGTVGQPLPHTEVSILSFEPQHLPQRKEEQGLIAVRGPQVMLGYLKDTAATAAAFKDDWFITGDVGYVDEDGFLVITGRQAQFAKIAGEMVSHFTVENAIAKIIAKSNGQVAVTSVPDPERGEKLVVLYTLDSEIVPETLVWQLKKKYGAQIWIPKAKDFVQINSLPTLASGKLDLKQIREMAKQAS